MSEVVERSSQRVLAAGHRSGLRDGRCARAAVRVFRFNATIDIG